MSLLSMFADSVREKVEQSVKEVEVCSPDGRWAMLQRWLAQYPHIREWAYLSTDKTFIELKDFAAVELRDFAAKKLDFPGILLDSLIDDALSKLITGPTEIRIKAAIETLQTVYRERANQDQPEQQKEKKNVRARRIKHAKTT